MLTKKQINTIIELLESEVANCWKGMKDDADETPYIEYINDIIGILADMQEDAPMCSFCNDTGIIDTEMEDDEGRAIDTESNCDCRDI